MIRWRQALAVVILAANAVEAQSGRETARLLAEESEVVRDLLLKNPELPDHWREDFWSDALLRGAQIPGTPWRSHDLRRPQPRIVPPEELFCASSPPPAGAVALLAGGDLSQWSGPVDQWAIIDGVLEPAGVASNRLASIPRFGSARVHVEFATPQPAIGNWQYRGNSGVFLMGLYEVQILDSWKNPVYPDGQMGAVYGQHPPLLNASLPPGAWQCLDILFTAPVFDSGSLVSPARVTAYHNGALIHDDVPVFGPTGFQSWRHYEEHAETLPLTLQDHGDGSRVRFRNIWVQDIQEQD